MSLWRIVFAGNTDMDVQGVYFRQLIKGIADKEKIRGQVRNLRDGMVEVICDCEKTKAEKFYNTIKKEANERRIKIKEEGSKLTYNVFDFKDFEIIREDDLKEMVWALQGAGRVFKEQEEINKEEAVNGLKYELSAISDTIQKMIDEGEKNRRLRTLSMENILKHPPATLDEKTIQDISDLYQMCLEVNDTSKAKIDERLKKDLEDTMKKAANIDDKLKNNPKKA